MKTNKNNKILKNIHETHNEFIFRIYRKSMSGSVRGRLRPGHLRARGHDQEHRVRDHRSCLRAGLDRAEQAWPKYRQAGGGHWIWPSGPGRRSSAQQSRPSGNGVREKRSCRWTTAVRHSHDEAFQGGRAEASEFACRGGHYLQNRRWRWKDCHGKGELILLKFPCVLRQ